MKVTSLIFPFGEIKKLGKKGITFRCVTSCRKAGKQSDETRDNYISKFYDCKTFNPDVIKVLYTAYNENTHKYAGIDIDAFVEVNSYTDRNGNERENMVFNIQTAKLHETTAPF